MKNARSNFREDKPSPDAGWMPGILPDSGAAAASRLLAPGELDLERTLECGQAFRWRRVPDGEPASGNEITSPIWRAVVRERIVSLWRSGDRIGASMNPGPFDAALLNHYLDIHLNLEAVRSEIAVDNHVRAALDTYPGLRILQQEPWETLISFILSQWSNVPRIAGQVEALSRTYGEEITPGWHAFPRPEALAAATPDALRSLGLGYRVPYVIRAARKCAEQGIGWLENLARMQYRAARDCIVIADSPARAAKRLSTRTPASEKVHGVGAKVADCVLLFSLGHYEAVPVDVHVRRAMERWYGDHAAFTNRYDSVADFARQHFGRYAGYAQQYLFHRQRTGG